MKREISATRINVTSNSKVSGENVVQRLRRRIKDVRDAGTMVRTDWLDGQEASWCELRGTRTIILDATQPAADQLSQLEDILRDIKQFSASHSAPSNRSRETNLAA